MKQLLNPKRKKSLRSTHVLIAIVMVVLSCASTQIYAQAPGATVGDTAQSGASTLNTKGNFSVGDSAHIAVPAPANGASIQGDLLIGTTNLGNAKVIIDGTGKLVALEVQGTFYFIQQDQGPIQKTLDGKCWLLLPEPQPDGKTAIPKYYLVTCPY